MGAVTKEKYLTQAGWEDAPHLSEEERAIMIASTPAYLLPARRFGDPTVGVGRIYPFDIAKVSCDPFHLPDSWPRVFSMDPGFNLTAALWGAIDEASQTLYLYSEYYAKHQVPRMHVAAINARGSWVPGLCDPASEGKNSEGRKLIAVYRQLGLTTLRGANNEVAAGIQAATDLITTGRLKVFTTLQNFRHEWNLYHRNLDGKIVKVRDHLMDCLRYLVLGGMQRATVNPSFISKMTTMGGGIADSRAGF